jgi:phosphate transport system protein
LDDRLNGYERLFGKFKINMASAREHFDRQMQGVLDQVQILGSMAEQAVNASVEALLRGNLAASRQIYTGDQRINEKRYEIEEAILTLIATQQPMARDLRLLSANLEIITELERIADYAKGIAKINLLLGPERMLVAPPDLGQMADLATELLERGLQAFVRRDAQEARRLPIEDEKVDILYDQIYHEMLKFMIADPATVNQANYLIWAAHNLERMADRVTNICERTIFAVTGEIMELDQPVRID